MCSESSGRISLHSFFFFFLKTGLSGDQPLREIDKEAASSIALAQKIRGVTFLCPKQFLETYFNPILLLIVISQGILKRVAVNSSCLGLCM